jgi:hypothetical protein
MSPDSRGKPERRSPARLVIPNCPNCTTNEYVTVTNRPGLVVHLRCDHCLFVWSVPKYAPDEISKGRRG